MLTGCREEGGGAGFGKKDKTASDSIWTKVSEQNINIKTGQNWEPYRCELFRWHWKAQPRSQTYPSVGYSRRGLIWLWLQMQVQWGLQCHLYWTPWQFQTWRHKGEYFSYTEHGSSLPFSKMVIKCSKLSQFQIFREPVFQPVGVEAVTELPPFAETATLCSNARN